MTYMTAEDFKSASGVESYRKVVRQIAAEVADATGVKVEVIYGGSRRARDCRARELVCYIAKRNGLSLPEIGDALSRHHTTILSAVRNESRRRGEAEE